MLCGDTIFLLLQCHCNMMAQALFLRVSIFAKNPVQFGLPCWHIMQPYLRSNNSPIPADFVHPRWFISPLSPPQPAANASLSSDTTPDPTPNPRPRHYLAGSGETLLAKEAIEAEAFRAQLGSENGERYALAPDGNSQAFTIGFVPRAKLTKHQEELRKKALSRKMSRFLTTQELADMNLKKRRRDENSRVPPSSAPAALAGDRNEPPPRKRASRAANPVPAETQDMDEWERQWDRERLENQSFLLESSSNEDEWDRHGDADSLDLCEISTQDRELMEGYDAQREGRRGDTQETAIEIVGFC
ncbi:hypothetical protein FN846DRAFT_1013026 [Sphaerosporella brunnea]|uniref:Uncharacterized protein n=1 Tax=Sphaerosporella brunnea TaxID=1250544 RepID=A0A5J5EBZ5_9PEZI|nr:hypothetical protein FN846DRAFT_1013026 [Sphaerosporella brunnea]